MTNEEFLKDVCPNHTEKSKWNISELLHILDMHKKQLSIPRVVSSTCKKEEIIEVLEKRRKEAFDNQFHKYENNEMLHAIKIIERLIPPTE